MKLPVNKTRDWITKGLQTISTAVMAYWCTMAVLEGAAQPHVFVLSAFLLTIAWYLPAVLIYAGEMILILLGTIVSRGRQTTS